jgi:hypothetical protein
MKSKYIFTVVVGFVIFVHAHYISSWINYYEAPMLNRTQFNDHLDAGHSTGFNETIPVFTSDLPVDSTTVLTTDSAFSGKGSGDKVLRLK